MIQLGNLNAESSEEELDEELLELLSTFETEDDDWFVLVHTVCEHLRPDNRCGIYETRPKICRDYTTDQCEYEDEYTFDRYFETSEQVAEYANARFSDATTFRSPKPSGLPIIN